jgi:ATP-dependent DNA helicase PIF1
MLVDQLNYQKLMELSAEEFTFNAEITGLFDLKQFPTDFSLKLREGAQVMFLKNDPEGAYVNGTIGKVIELSFDKIIVETVDDYLESKKLITLTPYTWEILKYTLTEDNKIDTAVIGAFKQFPLRLAWAITIHKSQGKTFDRVIIDMGRGGAFEFGQTYVALSRCRTLEGIVLKQPLSLRDIHVDNRVLEYYDKLKND